MSLPKKVSGICSKCNKSNEFVVYDTINTDLFPDVPRRIISGELFKTECSHCGASLTFEYPTLYHDMKHNAMIKIISEEKPSQEELDLTHKMMGMFGEYVSRLVKNTRELGEKVEIIEAGLDDRTIEIQKLFTTVQIQKEKPDFEFANAYFTMEDGKQIINVYNTNGQYITTWFDEDGYLNMEECLHEVYKKHPTPHFAIIDRAWALEMLQPLLEAQEELSKKHGMTSEEYFTMRKTERKQENRKNEKTEVLNKNSTKSNNLWSRIKEFFK